MAEEMKQDKSVETVLIYPPYERLKDLPVKTAPWSLLLLGTILRDRGLPVSVYNGEYFSGTTDLQYTSKDRRECAGRYRAAIDNPNHPAWLDLRAALKELRPKYIGITFMTPTFSAAEHCIKIAKEILPSVKIIAGGPHCTMFPERMAAHPLVDFAIFEEGDYTLPDLIQTLRGNGSSDHYDHIQGIAYRKANGTVVKNAPRPYVKKLDDLPIPDRSLLYNYGIFPAEAFGSMLGSRGCPYDCTFCASVPMWGRTARFRSSEHMAREVEYLVSLKVPSIRFFDDTYTLHKTQVADFCRKMVERGLNKKVSWSCETRVNVISDELVALMRKAGCRGVSIGVESGSNKIMKALDKDITTDMVRRAVKILRSHNILVGTYFMVGLPMETAEDTRSTIEFMKEIKPDSVTLCTFVPLPGTALFNDLANRGVISKDPNFNFYDNVAHHSTESYFCLDIPKDEFTRLSKEAMEVATYFTTRYTKSKLINKFNDMRKNYRYHLGRIVKNPRLIGNYTKRLWNLAFEPIPGTM